jgi:hypothetical protein
MRILRKIICPSSNGKTFRNMCEEEGKRKRKVKEERSCH